MDVIDLVPYQQRHRQQRRRNRELRHYQTPTQARTTHAAPLYYGRRLKARHDPSRVRARDQSNPHRQGRSPGIGRTRPV